MKKLVTLCLLFVTTATFAQVNAITGRNYHNMYNDAIKRFISIARKQTKAFPDTLYVDDYCGCNQDDIIPKISGVRMETLNWEVDHRIIDTLKNRQHPYLVIGLTNLYFKKGEFWIVVSVNDKLKKDGEPEYKFERSIAFYYKYDSSKNIFVFSRYSYGIVIHSIATPDATF